MLILSVFTIYTPRFLNNVFSINAIIYSVSANYILHLIDHHISDQKAKAERAAAERPSFDCPCSFQVYFSLGNHAYDMVNQISHG